MFSDSGLSFPGPSGKSPAAFRASARRGGFRLAEVEGIAGHFVPSAEIWLSFFGAFALGCVLWPGRPIDPADGRIGAERSGWERMGPKGRGGGAGDQRVFVGGEPIAPGGLFRT